MGCTVQFGNVKSALAAAQSSVKSNPHKELESNVYVLLNNITARAPVDTGRYKGAWKVVKKGKGSFEIRNSVEYAQHLIYGTVDRSIAHDVRGIVRYWKNHIYTSAVTTWLK
jgi:hypothetical protein